MLINRLVPLMLAVLLMAGCAAPQKQSSEWELTTVRPSYTTAAGAYGEGGSGTPDAVSSPEWSRHSDLKALLYSQLKEWRSVRYRYGGMSRDGLDCSALVYLTYRDRLGIELPRDTRYQSRIGEAIDQVDLVPGDLVFFQIDRNTRHVGIYLEDRQFMHVSFKKGVTLSSLDNAYWAKRYWKAVRVPGALMAAALQ